jgi:CTP:molybdopterin cytidylyltransferase MocA
MAAGVLLAAGESVRMGRPKPLLPWGDATLVEYQVGEMLGAGLERVIVVLGHAWQDVKPYLTGPAVEVVINEAYRESKAASLRAVAASLLDEDEAVAILSVDQPRPRDVLARLLAAHDAGVGLMTVPVHGGRRGHPSILAGALIPELRNVLDETLGLRGLIERHRASLREVPFETPIVLLDLNTPDEYRQAHELFFGWSPAAL